MEPAVTLQTADVVGSGSSHLDNARVGEDIAKRIMHTYALHPEQESLARAGQLQQRHSRLGSMRREARFGLCVKAKNLLPFEVAYGIFEIIPQRVNHGNLAREHPQREGLYDLRQDSFYEIVFLHFQSFSPVSL